MVFGANTDIAQSVREDVEWVRGHPLIRKGVQKGC
jgi:hypothetical protein